jgi:hypothetical protein
VEEGIARVKEGHTRVKEPTRVSSTSETGDER